VPVVTGIPEPAIFADDCAGSMPGGGHLVR
jgi:hypothetical protein